MQRTRSYPSVLIEHTHTGSAIAALGEVQVNLTRASLPAAIRAKIPVHLNTSLRGTVEGITFQLDQAAVVPITIKFFGTDTFDTFATSRFLGEEDAAEADFHPSGSAEQTFHTGDTNIEYEDEDGTGEFHFSITNDDAAADAIGDGDLKIGIIWRPRFPG